MCTLNWSWKVLFRSLLSGWLLTALLLGPASTAGAQDWPNVPLVQHSTYQAVNGDGSGAYPPAAFPIRLLGVVLNNSEDWLDPTANYLEGPMFAMGGESEIYVQTVDPTDFGGTCAWMGQNYGNHIWHFPEWDYNYSDAEWYAELDRLHLYRPESPLPDADLVRAGDLIEMRARGGLNYKGKQNVNEQHSNEPEFDFEIVILQNGYRLPEARPITLSQVKDAGDNALFDPTRATGGERYQATRVALRSVSFKDFDALADWHSDTVPDLLVEDGTGRTLPVHLGRNESFDSTSAPSGCFDVVAIIDQNSSSMTACVDGYRALAMNAADFHEVSRWTSNADNHWSTATNWDRGSAPGDGSSLVFDGATTLLGSHNDIVDRQVFGITFAERDGWQVGGNPLTVSGYVVAENDATLEIDLALAANQAWEVADTKILAVNGTVNGDVNLLKIGAGALNLNNDASFGGTVTVESGTVNVGHGATVEMEKFYSAGTLALGANALVRLTHEWVAGGLTASPNDSWIAGSHLTVAAGAALDVNKSGVVLSDTNYAAVVGMLDDDLTAGPTAGQIISSAATAANSADPAHPRSVAVVDGGEGDVTVRYAANGDTDLDGKVKLADYITLKNNYNPLAEDRTWSQGDFNYDRDVDLADYIQLKSNYSPVFTYSTGPEGVPVPPPFAEPGPGEVDCLVNMLTGEITLHGNNAQFQGLELISPGGGLLVDADTGPFFGGDTLVGENQFYAEFAPLAADPFELDGIRSLGIIYDSGLNTMDLEVNIGLNAVEPTYLVPEPGTLGMVVLSATGLVLAAWRRRRRAARLLADKVRPN